MWTAPVSRDVPVLRELDMNAPLSGVAEAQARAAEAEEELKRAQSVYVSRPSAASFRKLVK